MSEWLSKPCLPSCLILALALFSVGCAPDDSEDSAATATARASRPATPLPVLDTVPEFALTDQSASAFGSADLEGKVWIASVISSRSTTDTPRQMAIFAQVWEQMTAEALWPSVRLVSFTAEPERDTPAVLSAFAARHGADTLHWKFVTGVQQEVADVLEGLGLPLDDGARTSVQPLTPSSKFVLVDRQHRVRGLYDVFTTPQLQQLMSDLGRILTEAPHLGEGDATHLVIPPENLNLSWVEPRRDAQLDAAAAFDVFHDFQFRDVREESGITFRNKIVNNAGKDWMPNHYDHGNGVAVADVDGDGRIDLYFTTQVGSNELWRNVGGGRFENVTESAGVGLPDRISVTASFADIDNDGDPDLYVTSVKGGNVLFENDGSGEFTDVTSRSGLGYVGHSSSAVFFDYDRDGLLDLFLVNIGAYTSDRVLPVTNGTSPEQSNGRYSFYEGREDAFTAHIQPDRAEASILYRNLGGGRFEDVSESTGLVDSTWSGDATPIDANRDGWPDLYVLNMQGDDEYYENVRGERFVRKSRALFPETPWGSMGVKSFDYDNDGDMDLFITDMHSDMSEHIGVERETLKSRMQWPDSVVGGGRPSIFGNAFYRREGAGSYREVSDLIGAENYWPWGLSIGDLNADGYQDAFVASSMNFPFRYGVNAVLLNDGGERFLNAEYVLGVEPRRNEKTLTPWFTLACDGADRTHRYCRGRSGDVVVWGAVGSRSSAVFDIDDDGDLDIVTNDFNSEPMVLLSDLSERKSDLNYLKVRLEGTASNRDALGARVSVRAGGDTYTRVVDGVTGYLSHGILPLYFGLDDATSVEQIEVQWPSGETQIVDGPIDVNTAVEIRED